MGWTTCQPPGLGQIPSKTHFYHIKGFPGRSKKLHTTRGVIFCRGSEPICLAKSAKNHQKRMSTNILKMSPNICPYIGLEIPLHGDSNFTVMFLCPPPVTSTLGIPQGNTFFFRRDDGPHFARKPPMWEPPKSTKAGAPTVFSLARPGNTQSLFPHL